MPDEIQPVDPSEIPLGYEPITGPQTLEEAKTLHETLKPKHGRALLLVRDGELVTFWVLYFQFPNFKKS